MITMTVNSLHRLWPIVLLLFIYEAHGQLECVPTTETLVHSPHVDDTTMPTCTELISLPPDLSRLDFRQECARWMGTAEPVYVNNYFINYCFEYSSYTRYKAGICCEGATTDLRCFQTTNYTSDYDGAYQGTVSTCAAGQVCQTTTMFYEEYPYTNNIRTTGCGDSTICQGLSSNNTYTCQSWIPAPQCTECCSEAFCNYDTIEYNRELAYDPCVSNPCYYGGTCTSDIPNWTYNCTCVPPYSGDRCRTTSCSSSPCDNGGYCAEDGTDFYCHCKQAWGGPTCSEEYPLCDAGITYCLNGATCIDQGSGVYKCACTSGFVGSRCEMPTLTCSYPPSLYQYGSVYSSTISSPNCTERALSEKQYLTGSYVDNYCPGHMQQTGNPRFVDDVHGNVDRLESAGLYYCEEGDGKLWYSDEFCCPTCHSMPCQNGAWCIQESTTYQDYICQCRAGWTGAQCQNTPRLCIIAGDPHYTTFDSNLIHYQGDGEFQLTGSDATVPSSQYFLITGTNSRVPGRPDPPVSYLSAITTHALSNTVLFYYQGNQLRVKVNGKKFDPNDEVLDIPGMSITLAGNELLLEATVISIPEAIISVRFSASSIGYIDLPPEFLNQVKGICGDADGNPHNDLTTKEGVDVTNSTNRYTLIGDSWEIGSALQKKRRSVPMANDIIAHCEPVFEEMVSSNMYCGLIRDTSSVFANCILDTLVDNTMDYDNCYYDVCAHTNETSDLMKEMACRNLEAFVVKCQSKGHVANWRGTADCPLECPDPTEYKFSATACHATCSWPDGPEQCHLPQTEGCYCPSEMVLNVNGTCDAAQSCGCLDERGNRRPIGVSWLSSDCKTNNTCEECTTCTRPVGQANIKPYGCDISEVCQPNGDDDFQCQEISGCPGCTCTDSNGGTWQLGESGLSEDCQLNITCIICEECLAPSGVFMNTTHECAVTDTCAAAHGQGICVDMEDGAAHVVCTNLVLYVLLVAAISRLFMD